MEKKKKIGGNPAKNCEWTDEQMDTDWHNLIEPLRFARAQSNSDDNWHSSE